MSAPLPSDESTPSPANTNGRVVRRKGLGGLLNFYYRAA